LVGGFDIVAANSIGRWIAWFYFFICWSSRQSSSTWHIDHHHHNIIIIVFYCCSGIFLCFHVSSVFCFCRTGLLLLVEPETRTSDFWLAELIYDCGRQ
jgi:hypothetical protein